MSDDEYAVQRMLDGESDEDDDTSNNVTNEELPPGSLVDLTMPIALLEATVRLREQRPKNAFAMMMSHSRLQGTQPSRRASRSSSSSQK